MACGILAPWPEIEPVSPAFEGGFLATGPPRKACGRQISWIGCQNTSLRSWRLSREWNDVGVQVHSWGQQILVLGNRRCKGPGWERDFTRDSIVASESWESEVSHRKWEGATHRASLAIMKGLGFMVSQCEVLNRGIFSTLTITLIVPSFVTSNSFYMLMISEYLFLTQTSVLNSRFFLWLPAQLST